MLVYWPIFPKVSKGFFISAHLQMGLIRSIFPGIFERQCFTTNTSLFALRKFFFLQAQFSNIICNNVQAVARVLQVSQVPPEGEYNILMSQLLTLFAVY